MHSKKQCLYKAFLPEFMHEELAGFFPSRVGNVSNESWKGNQQFLLGMAEQGASRQESGNVGWLGNVLRGLWG